MAVSKKLTQSILTGAETYSDNVLITPLQEEIVVEKMIASRCVLGGGSASALTDCTFKLYVNNELLEVLFNNWCERNVQFTAQKRLSLGDQVKITCEHNSLSNCSVFASLVIMEY